MAVLARTLDDPAISCGVGSTPHHRRPAITTFRVGCRRRFSTRSSPAGRKRPPRHCPAPAGLWQLVGGRSSASAASVASGRTWPSRCSAVRIASMAPLHLPPPLCLQAANLRRDCGVPTRRAGRPGPLGGKPVNSEGLRRDPATPPGSRASVYEWNETACGLPTADEDWRSTTVRLNCPGCLEVPADERRAGNAERAREARGTPERSAAAVGQTW